MRYEVEVRNENTGYIDTLHFNYECYGRLNEIEEVIRWTWDESPSDFIVLGITVEIEDQPLDNDIPCLLPDILKGDYQYYDEGFVSYNMDKPADQLVNEMILIREYSRYYEEVCEIPFSMYYANMYLEGVYYGSSWDYSVFNYRNTGKSDIISLIYLEKEKGIVPTGLNENYAKSKEYSRLWFMFYNPLLRYFYKYSNNYLANKEKFDKEVRGYRNEGVLEKDYHNTIRGYLLFLKYSGNNYLDNLLKEAYHLKILKDSTTAYKYYCSKLNISEDIFNYLLIHSWLSKYN